MKTKALIIAVALVSSSSVFASSIFSGSKNKSVGFALGARTGVNYQQALPNKNALSVIAGAENENPIVSADHNWYFNKIWELDPFFGLGLGNKFINDANDDDDELVFEGRLPVGVSYFSKQKDMMSFLQAIPTVDSTDSTNIQLQVGLNYIF